MVDYCVYRGIGWQWIALGMLIPIYSTTNNQPLYDLSAVLPEAHGG